MRAIRMFRDKAGLTQAELAAQVGCQQHHISRWEHGNVRLNDANLAKIAKALDMTPWELRYAECLLERRETVEEAVQGYALA